ncbi:MAG: ABC transporter substrate-binding protein [Curvibacter sp.]|nr:ABC transporter substrate-binding protein [Curvibacter sp.]
MTQPSLQRRQWMALSGSGLAGLSVTPGAVQAATLPTRPRLKLGVLVPQSARDSQLGDDYLKGLQQGLSTTTPDQTEPEWSVQTMGPSRGSMVRAMDSLLREQPRLDLVVGWIGLPGARHLRPALTQARIPLLASDLGTQRAHADDAHPWIAYHTLGYWQSCARLGQLVAQAGCRRAVICQGFHEAGYGFVAEFKRHFEAAGGRVLGQHISGLPQNKDEFEGLMPVLKQSRPDVVVAFYSGRQAKRFRQVYGQSDAAQQAQFAGPALGGDLGTDLKTPSIALAPWTWVSSGSPHPADANLLQRNSPGLALGLAAGARIASALQHPDWPQHHQRPQLLALARSSTAAADAAKTGDHRLWLTRSDRQGLLTCTPSSGLPRALHDPGQRPGSRSGWTNTYLIT